jgi:hypothetical protein
MTPNQNDAKTPLPVYITREDRRLLRVRAAQQDTSMTAHVESLVRRDLHGPHVVDELRAVYKRWFLDGHDGLTFQQAMEGIAADLDLVIQLATHGPEWAREQGLEDDPLRREDEAS